MIVVSDTTPLITLMKAQRLDILHSLFGQIIIPQAVFNELTSSEKHRDEADIIRNTEYINAIKFTS